MMLSLFDVSITGNALKMPRSAFIVSALTTLVCSACTPAGGGQAQSPAPVAKAQTLAPIAPSDPLSAAGWTIQRADAEGIKAIHTKRGAWIELQIIDTRLAETDALSEQDILDSVLDVLGSQFDASCPGLSDAPPRPMAKGSEKSINGRYLCSAMASMQGPFVVAMFASETQSAKINARGLALEYGAKLLSQEPLGVRVSSPVEASPVETDKPITGQGASSLTAAIAQIPANRRPVDVSYVGEWDSVSMSTQYVPWFLLGDGTASPAECLYQSGCDSAPYRKRGNQIELAVEDEVLDGEGDHRPFKPGERVDLSLGNVGGVSFGLAGSQGGQVSSGALEMTKDGRIIVGEDIANNIYGGGFSASASSSGSVSGTYYLDGYLIAIDDGNGNIGVGTILRKYEGRDLYIYLNGELYWE
jgi:hypothetical protein